MENKKKQNKGFTLVELLAVIVILAIILVIAVPQVMSVIEDSKKATLESTAKMIASTAEKQKVQNTVLGKETQITCDSVAKINKLDYEDCDIEFDDNTAKVTIKGSGKFDGFYVCGGTKTNAEAIEGGCDEVTLTVNLNGGTGKLNYKSSYEPGTVVALTAPTKEGYSFGGWTVTGTDAKATKTSLTMGSDATTITAIWKEIINCTYDGELVQGVEFTHNQYTYRYKQEYHYIGDVTGWVDIESDGWGVILTDKYSTEPVNTPLCTYINGKPLVSTTSMFVEVNYIKSQAESIDVSSWNTSTVTNMNAMFTLALYDSESFNLTGLETLDTSSVTDMHLMLGHIGSPSGTVDLDLSGWDVSNVTDMSYMFEGVGNEYGTININLSGWNVSNVINMEDMFYEFGESAETLNLDLSGWDTSNVTDMSKLFYEFGEYAGILNLDLSGWDTSNVTDMSELFYEFGENSETLNLDLSGWDTSNVTDMEDMFSYIGYFVTEFNLTLGNKFKFSSDTDLTLCNWVKTHDVDGNALSDTTQYTTDELILFTGSTTPSIGGTWSIVE